MTQDKIAHPPIVSYEEWLGERKKLLEHEKSMCIQNSQLPGLDGIAHKPFPLLTGLYIKGWSVFHRRYGRKAELVVLSHVGFNRDKTLALFHISSGIGPMAAGGSLYLCERKNGKWVVKMHIPTWTT